MWCRQDKLSSHNGGTLTSCREATTAAGERGRSALLIPECLG